MVAIALPIEVAKKKNLPAAHSTRRTVGPRLGAGRTSMDDYLVLEYNPMNQSNLRHETLRSHDGIRESEQAARNNAGLV